MTWRRLGILAALWWVLIASAPAAAQTGHEEAICSQPWVLTCITFEDYPLGTIAPGVQRYKDKGWGISTGALQGIVTEDGKKWIQMVFPQNSVSGGYMGQDLPSKQRTVYWRWVVKYSPNYIWSPIATKHNELYTNYSLDSGIFNFTNNHSTKMPKITYILNAKCAAGQCWFIPNANGGFAGFTPGQTYTVEARVTMNTCPSCNDGVVQGWIDDVLKIDYANVNLNNTQSNPLTTGILLGSYWNCDANESCSASQFNHPTMYRYERNHIVATQRIGLVGGGGVTPPPVSPNAPGAPTLR
jgi:hypothetical protein